MPVEEPQPSPPEFSELVELLRTARISLDSIRGLVAAQGVALAPTHSTGEVEVTVRDSESGKPLEAAQVYIEGARIGALSDSSGSVLLAGVPAGPQELRADLIGYASVSVPIVVPTTGGLTALITTSELDIEFCDIFWSPPGPGAVRVRVFDSVTAEPVEVAINLRVSDGLQEWQVTGPPGDGSRHVAAVGTGKGPFVIEVSAPGYVPWVGMTPQLQGGDCPPPTSAHDVWLVPGVDG